MPGLIYFGGYLGSVILIFWRHSHLWANVALAWLLLALLLRLVLGSTQVQGRQNLICAANALLAISSVIIIALVTAVLGYRYNSALDWSAEQAFQIDAAATALIQGELPPGDSIEAIALIGYSEHHEHEHSERDNERYFILRQLFRKFSDSLNRPGQERFRYRFIHPALPSPKVADYIKSGQARQAEIARLQNQYGVAGYREVIISYRRSYYILNDADLFTKKLEPDQVPRLLVLWRKIYERWWHSRSSS